MSEFKNKVAELIDYCEATGEPPVAHVTEKLLGLSEDELAAMRRGERGEAKRKEAERLQSYREYFWVKKGLSDSKWATFSTFFLKELKGEDGEDGAEILTVRFEGRTEDVFK